MSEGTNAVSGALAVLSRYDFEYLRELYDEDRPAHVACFEEAVAELRRFFAMIVVQDAALAVTNKAVDRLWHVLVIHTEDYAMFCDMLVGDVIDHRPHSDRRPVPPEAISNTYRTYRRRFGPVPDSWIPAGSVTRAQIGSGQLPDQLEMRWSGWPGRSRVETS